MVQITPPATGDNEIIPRPAQVQPSAGKFILNANTVIRTDALSEKSAIALSEMLAPATGFHIRVRGIDKTVETNSINLQINPNRPELGEEGYELSVRPETIRIQAYRPAGLFYAGQTLRHLLPKEILMTSKAPVCPWAIPCGDIKDRPRFSWRGLMLDTARYFLPVNFLKRYIDLLALYKMNRLHLHLTDNQAWTLEIKKYPILTDMSRRPQEPGRARGVYPQKDIREVVEYAAARQVMIVPEIEFPGHSDTVLTAMPELMCVNNPCRIGKPGQKEFCPGREDVFTFFEDVISEVAALFDAPFIHIGGDEYAGPHWDHCPDCQRRIREENLEAGDTEELRNLFRNCLGSPRKYLLYRYLMRRAARIVTAQNRIPILWDDLSWRENFPEKSVILQWHYKDLFDFMHKAVTPDNPAREAARAGHAAIIAPASHLYFDYFDGGKFIRKLYEFNPIPHDLAEDQVKSILGPHACVWEQPQEKIDAMVFPRMLALAEQAWTPAEFRQWDHFAPRLQKQLSRLDILGVAYTPPLAGRDCTSRMENKWHHPEPKGWRLLDWQANEVINENGTFELTLHLTGGKEQVTIEKALWVDDGNEIPLENIPSANPDTLRYQFNVSNYKPDSLYGIRLYYHWDSDAGCSGEALLVKKT